MDKSYKETAKVIQKEIDNLNSSISFKKIEFVCQNSPINKAQVHRPALINNKEHLLSVFDSKIFLMTQTL